MAPSLRPIFHQAFFGRVGADTPIYFASGTFQMNFVTIQKMNFKKLFA